MSILSVAFRLEIAEGCFIPNLEYYSKGIVRSYAEATSGPNRQESHTASVKDLTTLKGQRTLKEVTIETYMADPSEAGQDQSYTGEKESVCEKSDDTRVQSIEKNTNVTNDQAPAITAKDNADKDPSNSLFQTGTAFTSKSEEKRESQESIKPQIKAKDGKSRSSKKSKSQGNSQRKDNVDRDGSEISVQQRELTISKALKHDKEPLELQTLAKKAIRHSDGASGCDSETGNRAGSAHAVRSISPTASAIPFSSGNPCVENTEGIVHLYRDKAMMSVTGSELPTSEMLCFLGVPTRMTSHDVIQFLAPVEGWIEHIKVIRNNSANEYMLLVKFRTHKNAWDFYKNFNNKPYNSVEQDLCYLAFVSRLEAVKSDSDAGLLPIAGLVELPVCPVCLERMDESVNGILQVQCNHSFHTACLAHWEDTSCPVCRFAQTPEPTGGNACFECQSQDSLWICLICGHVGCGRYTKRHAYGHFQETNHTYAMQLSTDRVWDYAGDNYVHRLIQNKSDGKMVQVDERGNRVDSDKVDSLALEYAYLVNTQMESQRNYFQEKILHVEKEALTQVEQLEEKNKQLKDKYTETQKQLTSINKEKQGGDKKYTQVNQKLSHLQRQFDDERELNRSLQTNQSHWTQTIQSLQENLTRKDQEMEELREQLRDVMFYLDGGQKLASSTEVSQEEIQQGQVVIGESPTTTSSGRKPRKKGR